MNHISDQIFAYLSNNLDDNSKLAVEEHLKTCSQCEKEFSEEKIFWADLKKLPDFNPSKKITSNFYTMLREEENKVSGFEQKQSFFDFIFPKKPVYQVAITLTSLVVGILLGYLIKVSHSENDSIVQLQNEVSNMNKMLTVSLLQQQSATDRLKGVSLCNQTINQSDPEICNALIQTLKFDSNVNVRLAALDVLKDMVNQQSVRKELIESLPKQKSPMIQIALVDLMVQLQEKESVTVMKEMLTNPNLNASAKQRLEMGIKQLM